MKTREIIQTLGIPDDVIDSQMELARKLEQDFILGDVREDDFFQDYQTILDARKVRAINAILDSGGEIDDLSSLENGFISVAPVWEGDRLAIGKISGDKIDVPFENIFGYDPEGGLLIYTSLNGYSLKGGQGSGNWGHGGLAGVHGGSSPTKGMGRFVSTDTFELNEVAEQVAWHYSFSDFEKKFRYPQDWEMGDTLIEYQISFVTADGGICTTYPHSYVVSRINNKTRDHMRMGEMLYKTGLVRCVQPITGEGGIEVTERGITEKQVRVLGKIAKNLGGGSIRYSIKATDGHEITSGYGIQDLLDDLEEIRGKTLKGGKGSGNWGHSGLAGIWGGSSSAGKTPSWNDRGYAVVESYQSAVALNPKNRDDYGLSYWVLPDNKLLVSQNPVMEHTGVLYDYLKNNEVDWATEEEKEEFYENFNRYARQFGSIPFLIPPSLNKNLVRVSVHDDWIDFSTRKIDRSNLRKIQSLIESGKIPFHPDKEVAWSTYQSWNQHTHLYESEQSASLAGGLYNMEDLINASGFVLNRISGYNAPLGATSLALKGGQGSGNWGHSGLAGVWGGSSPTKGAGWNPKFDMPSESWIEENFKPIHGLTSKEVFRKTFEEIASVYLDEGLNTEDAIRKIIEENPEKLLDMAYHAKNYTNPPDELWANTTSARLYTRLENDEFVSWDVPQNNKQAIYDIVEPLNAQRQAYISEVCGFDKGLKAFLGDETYETAMGLMVRVPAHDNPEHGYLAYDNSKDYRERFYKVGARFHEMFGKMETSDVAGIHKDEFLAALDVFSKQDVEKNGLDSYSEVYRIAKDTYEFEVEKRVCDGSLNFEIKEHYSWTESNHRFNGFDLDDLQNGVKYLPDTLYHATTSVSGVKQSGILSRQELAWKLADENEVGLGGGSDNTISFSSNKETTEQIARSLCEAHAVANGNYKMEDMLVDAITGRNTGGARPFLRDIIEANVTRHGIGDLNRFIDEKGKLKVDDIIASGLLGWDYGRALKFETGSKTPIEKWDSLLGKHMGDKPLSPKIGKEKYLDILWSFWHIYFAGRRELAGGFMNPVFFGTNWKKLAKLDPKDFGVLVFKPKVNAKGTLMGALGEWRIVGNSAVKLDAVLQGFLQEYLKDFDLNKLLGGA